MPFPVRTISLLAIFLMLFSGCDQSAQTDKAAYPQRPIKLIVPFAAGGGSDTFARILQKAIEDYNLLPEPLVIINVPGAGGTVGSRRVKNARPDGYTLLLLHEGILTSQSAGLANFGPDAFEPLCGTGRTGMVICVAGDSPFHTLQDLVEKAASEPETLLFSCSLGSPSHFAGLMIENAAPGSQFRYVQSGGGAKRFAGLQGGHADVTALSMAEYIQFRDSGLKALALLGEERDATAPDLMTATEQGFDVISSNMQFWWAPKGTSIDKMESMTNVIQQAMQTPEVKSRLSQLQIEPIVLTGNALQANLADRTVRIQRVSQRPTIALPNVPLMIFAAVAALTLYVLSQSFLSRRVAKIESDSEPASVAPPWKLAITIALLTCLYVLFMQFEWVGYQLATMGYVIVTGLLLTHLNLKSVTSMVGLALMLSIGLHYIFTQIFIIDLP
ncbi:tripartite tricarboxylate transporter substrate binding protein [Rubinisphaera italica]|uniref:Tripartite tricarboxylate transporter family receptor n=1 Tax=Rubinisphaera italica TaxID=2527969 RepID=A0A5C5XG82_9PLAN|nr:tripartite tricarboxylate transporter substrate binding protein [Rubinisphaera italica]TWT61758.1 Tripartite tricarboxylate transporter family receptor [Rubinisphaera italica]